MVTAIESAQYSDGKGGTYTSRTAVVLATDGQTYRYENQAGLSAGSLVQAEAAADRVTLRPLTAASLSGSVDRSAARPGPLSLCRRRGDIGRERQRRRARLSPAPGGDEPL